MSSTQPNPHRGKLRAILVASIILLPVLIWIVFISWGETRCKPLPVYKYTNATGDSVPRLIDYPQGLISQAGVSFGVESLAGKHHVAGFIFTTCPTTCPLVTRAMKEVKEGQEGTQDVAFVSYTVDPATDSAATLAAYAQAQQADWTFVTGDSSALKQLIRHSYLQPYQDAPGQREKITHSSMLVLVDKDQRIRGFYNTLRPEEMKKLQQELNVLRCEYKSQ